VAIFEDLLQRSRAFSAQGRSNKITIFIGDKMSSLPENLFFFFNIILINLIKDPLASS